MPQVALDRRRDGDGPAGPGPRRGRHRGSHASGPRSTGEIAVGRAGSGSGGGHRARHHGTGRFRTSSLALLALSATLAGGGLAVIGLLAAGGGQFTHNGAVALHPSAVASLPGAGREDGQGSALPSGSQPRYFIAPGPGASAAQPSAEPSRTAEATQSPTAAPSPARTSSAKAPAPAQPASPTAPAAQTAPASPTPKATPSPTAPASGGCSNPVFTTSAQFGTYTALPYVVTNDMWNSSGADATQTLSVCSPGNWSVTASMNNGNGGVKTYPNVHRAFSSVPISSLTSVTSSFSETTPGTGTYEAAYDIWLNAVADAAAGGDEVMIWNENHGQVPGGSPQGTATFGGRSYTVWKGSGNYVAFVANSTFTAGTLNLLEFFQWLINKGWIAGNSTLVEVDYGVEIVTTNSVPETFSFGNFSVDAS